MNNVPPTPPMPPMPAGIPGAPPTAPGPNLTVIPGGKSSPLATLRVDPPIPKELSDYLSHWKLGKRVWVAGTAYTFDWSSMKLIDYTQGPGYGQEFHPIDYVDETSDERDLAHEIWRKCIERARIYNDGNEHWIVVRCFFDNGSGNGTHEDGALKVCVPPDNPQWGDNDAYAVQRYGHGLKNHPFPHHGYQEIQMMGIAMSAIKMAFDANKDTISELRQQNKTLVEAADSVHARELKAKEDLAKQEYEKLKAEAFVSAIKTAGANLAQVLPVFGVKLSKIAIEKLTGTDVPKTERENMAFEAFCMLADKLENAGIKDPTKLKLAFKQLLKINPDDPIWDRLMPVLMEREVHVATRRAEEMARSLQPIEVILEQKAQTNSQANEVKLDPNDKPKPPTLPPGPPPQPTPPPSPDPERPMDPAPAATATSSPEQQPAFALDAICDLLERLEANRGVDITSMESVKFALGMAIGASDDDPIFEKLVPIIEECKRRKAARGG